MHYGKDALNVVPTRDTHLVRYFGGNGAHFCGLGAATRSKPYLRRFGDGDTRRRAVGTVGVGCFRFGRFPDLCLDRIQFLRMYKHANNLVAGDLAH